MMRKLKMNVKELKKKIRKIRYKVLSILDSINEKYYNIKYFIKNAFLFREELSQFRGWDASYYVVSILVRALDITADYNKNHGHLVLSDRMYRRARYMAHLFRDAYISNWEHKDPVHKLLADNLDISSDRSKGLKFTYGKLGEYKYNKLRDAHYKRVLEFSKSKKRHAVEYFLKHINNIWD